jgi:hypothetical protein
MYGNLVGLPTTSTTLSLGPSMYVVAKGFRLSLTPLFQLGDLARPLPGLNLSTAERLDTRLRLSWIF